MFNVNWSKDYFYKCFVQIYQNLFLIDLIFVCLDKIQNGKNLFMCKGAWLILIDLCKPTESSKIIFLLLSLVV